jgi:hypothetical protein
MVKHPLRIFAEILKKRPAERFIVNWMNRSITFCPVYEWILLENSL